MAIGTKSLIHSASAPLNQSTPIPHTYLQKRFQVGGASSEQKGEKISYALSQKIFHASDVPADVRQAKQIVHVSKKANILDTEQRAWNHSVIADPRVQKDNNPELKRKLLHVRAGLLDEKIQKPGKMHSDEAILERKKFVASMTGKGPIGPLSGKWVSTVDERGLSNHCINDDWPDWNNDHACHRKEDHKQAAHRTQECEERRHRMMAKNHNGKFNAEAYVPPHHAVANVNHILRERKIDYHDLKDEFKKVLKDEFPQASEERLQAMAQRLLQEKLLADEKMARFPANNEVFKPNLCLSTQDRRYRDYYHPGAWSWSEAEKRYTWSCCLHYSEDSRGCNYKVVNPDAWCTMGFESGPGLAACSRA